MLRIVYFTLLFSPFVMAQVINQVSHSRTEVEPASWGAFVFWVGLAYMVVSAGSTFVIERYFEKSYASVLREKGMDPDEVLVLVGSAVLLSPACWALVSFPKGELSLGLAYTCVAFSFFGVAAWGWRHRHLIAPST